MKKRKQNILFSKATEPYRSAKRTPSLRTYSLMEEDPSKVPKRSADQENKSCLVLKKKEKPLRRVAREVKTQERALKNERFEEKGAMWTAKQNATTESRVEENLTKFL